MSNPFFMVCRTTAIRRLLPTALFIDQGTHIEWLPENKAGTLTEEEITAEVTKMHPTTTRHTVLINEVNGGSSRISGVDPNP